MRLCQRLCTRLCHTSVGDSAGVGRRPLQATCVHANIRAHEHVQAWHADPFQTCPEHCAHAPDVVSDEHACVHDQEVRMRAPALGTSIVLEENGGMQIDGAVFLKRNVGMQIEGVVLFEKNGGTQIDCAVFL